MNKLGHHFVYFGFLKANIFCSQFTIITVYACHVANTKHHFTKTLF